MTDTTHKAPKRVYKFFEYGAEEHVRYDTAHAMVAAALTEAAADIQGDAMLSPTGAHRVSARILALITPDAQTALDRMLAAERERCAKLEALVAEWRSARSEAVLGEVQSWERLANAESSLAASRTGTTP